MRKPYIALSIIVHFAVLLWFLLHREDATPIQTTPIELQPIAIDATTRPEPKASEPIKSTDSQQLNQPTENPVHTSDTSHTETPSKQKHQIQTQPSVPTIQNPSSLNNQTNTTNNSESSAISSSMNIGSSISAPKHSTTPPPQTKNLSDQPLHNRPITTTLACSKTATRQSMRGSITVHVAVSSSGRVTHVTAIQASSDELMNQSAHASAMQLAFPKMSGQSTSTVKFIYDCAPS